MKSLWKTVCNLLRWSTSNAKFACSNRKTWRQNNCNNWCQLK